MVVGGGKPKVAAHVGEGGLAAGLAQLAAARGQEPMRGRMSTRWWWRRRHGCALFRPSATRSPACIRAQLMRGHAGAQSCWCAVMLVRGPDVKGREET